MSIKQTINKVFDENLANTPAVRLSVEEAKQFIDDIVDESVLFKQAKVVRIPIGVASKRITKISMSDDILYPAESGEAQTPSQYATAKKKGEVVLRPLELICTAKIKDDELEENVEGLAFEDHFMQMLAKQASNQLERVGLYARKVEDPTTTYGMFDGWITRAKRSGSVVDFSVGYTDRYIDRNKVSELYKSIPTKWRNDLTAYYMNNDLAVDYEDLYIQSQNRVPVDSANGKPFVKTPWISIYQPVATGTALTIANPIDAGDNTADLTNASSLAVGDTFVIAYGKAKEFSAKITAKATNTITVDVPFPFDYATANADENKVHKATMDGADLLLAGTDNLLVGISRDITIEFERVARERSTYAVMTLKIDFNTMWDEALAIGKSLLVR